MKPIDSAVALIAVPRLLMKSSKTSVSMVNSLRNSSRIASRSRSTRRACALASASSSRAPCSWFVPTSSKKPLSSVTKQSSCLSRTFMTSSQMRQSTKAFSLRCAGARRARHRLVPRNAVSGCSSMRSAGTSTPRARRSACSAISSSDGIRHSESRPNIRTSCSCAFLPARACSRIRCARWRAASVCTTSGTTSRPLIMPRFGPCPIDVGGGGGQG